MLAKEERVEINITSRKWVAMLGVMLLFCELSSGQTNNPWVEASLFKGLSGAAVQTFTNYYGAIKAGKEVDNAAGEIPSKYWTEPIKALMPLRVYIHRANVVVVQKITGNVEEGKYIYIPLSSYIPEPGVDGFIFSTNGNTYGNWYWDPVNGKMCRVLVAGTLDFKRTMGEAAKSQPSVGR